MCKEVKETIVLVQDINGRKIRDKIVEEMSIPEFLVFIGFMRQTHSSSEYFFYKKDMIIVSGVYRIYGIGGSSTVSKTYSSGFNVSKHLTYEETNYKNISSIINYLNNLEV